MSLRKPEALIVLLSTLFLVWGRIEPVSAHPHIWIDSRIEVFLDGDQIHALRVKWTFDAFFTRMIVMDYGQPQNGTFSTAQVEAIRSGAFDNLRHFGYFTMVRVNGREIPVERVENFYTYIDDAEHLVYQFDIPLELDLRGRSREIAVAMYDESFFTDIQFSRDFLTVHGGESVSWTSDLRSEIYQMPVWGPMNRETVVIAIRPR